MKERILILDDETSILDILQQHLTEEQYECVVTTSPKEAIGNLCEQSFAVLLTDLKMPEMDGIEVVRIAKDSDPDLGIIVITALVDVKHAIQALRIGAYDYVLKPFNLSEISLAVNRAVEKRNLVIENRRHQQELEGHVRAATSDLKQANEELRSTKEYLENLLHSTVDAIFTTDPAGVVTFANEGAISMMGHSREDFIGHPFSDFYAGGRDEGTYVQRLLRENAPLQNYETELKHKGDRLVPVNMSISFVKDADGRIASILAICKDITRQKKLEGELKEMSIKDSLTGLYNQRSFYDQLAAEIERARRQNHPLSLLLFDIDQFKTYNDCHGHLAGDSVLQTVGQVVTESTREHVDHGFRYGGDEFTVILPEADETQAYNIADRIRTSFESRRFDALTLSIGMMTYRQGYSLRTFVQFTDAMMYDAKRSGGNRIFVYRPEGDPPQEQE
ncbi:MAG: diguanylate cyclase [Candidatus Hydrogenedentes bacterium]|nr:diguanylate cyclase [Candidatus Hydrogenedentota bacterium]